MNIDNKLHYTCSGNPKNHTVIFLHGFMGSSDDWKDITNHLNEKYYCVAIDLPGHGKSPIDTEIDFDSLIVLLENLSQSLQLQNISIVGYSMGGRIALNWFVEHPERFDKIVLESSTPGIDNPRERIQRLKYDRQLADKLFHDSFVDFLNYWYGLEIFARIKEHKKYKDLINRRLSNSQEKLAVALEIFSTGNQKSFWPNLEKIYKPVLLICGKDDKKYVDIMTKMKKCNNNFELSIFHSYGHNVHFENPNQFAEHLVKFLSL